MQWDNSVKQRWAETPAWISHAGPGGWNDLDSLDVGNGAADGLTEDERQSYMTLWAISASPLYTGDDVTKLDKFGLSLLTHRDVLAINQQGKPARPVNSKTKQQVWRVRNNDGSYTVALFNLASQDKVVSTDWAELGFGGSASRCVTSGSARTSVGCAARSRPPCRRTARCCCGSRRRTT